MKKTCIILPAVCMLLIAAISCGRELKADPYATLTCSEEPANKEEQALAPAAGMQIQHIVIEKKSPGYTSQTGALLRISFDRVINPTGAVDDSVNRYVEDFIRNALATAGGDPDAPLEELAQNFLDAYEAACKNLPPGAHPPAWDYQVECRIRNPYNHLVSVECSRGGYTGGLHPDYSNLYPTYVVNDEAPVQRNRVFSNADKINGLARHISAPDAPSTASYSRFNAAGFYVNDHFTFCNDSIVFVFADYKQAPYCMGESEITLDIAAMSARLRERRDAVS